METSGPTSGIPPRPGLTGSTASAAWRPGQLLQATVTEVAAGRVLLAIGHRQVSAQTSLHLEKHQQLTLQVKSLGQQPVLRILSPAADTTLATAVRLLLPRQGPMTPLLSSLGQLAAAPRAALPGPVKDLIRSMVRQMPTVDQASTPRGLKQALDESGVFLERHLLQAPLPGAGPAIAGADFKAKLLRLLQLLRNWPASDSRGAPVVAQKPGTTGGTPNTPAPGAQTPVTPAPSAGTSGQASPAAPDQIRRAVNATLPPSEPSATATARPSRTAALPAAAPDAAGRASSAPPSADAPASAPPLRGSAPAPQTPLQVSVDMLHRLGTLRTDLLQQAEAALARIQLNQLAALPRDGERGLLEWLFELPIRRGDDLDLWSMRLFRDPPGDAQQRDFPAPAWSVQLAFDLPGLGPMQAQVRITGQQVSTQFWVEQAATLPLLRDNLPELRQALLHIGLEVGELECRTGPIQAGTAGRHEPLIDEKA